MKNRTIQGLRGLFAMGVVFSHCYFLGEYQQSFAIFDNVLQNLSNVSFFFIVAGYFLVNSTSVELPIGKFIKKKMLRIYPLHLLVLAVLIGLSIITGSFRFNVFLPLNALLIQTWIPSLESATSYNTVSWFLSSLVFCYIAGYCVVRSCRNGKKIGIYITAAVLVLYKIVIALIFPDGNTGYYWCYLCPIAGFADFMVGATLALVMRNKKAPPTVLLQVGAILALILTFAAKRLLPANYCRAFVMLPANILLLTAFSTETAFSEKVFGNKIMCFLGDISFEIYLIHTLVIGTLGSRSFMQQISAKISPFVTLTILLLCCIIAAVIYKYVFSFVAKRIKLNKE